MARTGWWRREDEARRRRRPALLRELDGLHRLADELAPQVEAAARTRQAALDAAVEKTLAMMGGAGR